ncbi:hypothetical protein JS562_04480 [Agrobacterium sp. S2]|nr:hypothetical protein [Agrobacterium sp. S2]
MTLFKSKTLLHHDDKIGFVRLWMGLPDFPTFLKKGLDAAPLTKGTEELARELVVSDFAPGKSVEFVRRVCRWGGDSRRGGKVIAHNPEDRIASQLRAAYQACIANDPGAAIREITSLKGLAISFGSKHLKFLDPNQHVVLDSIICEALGFSPTSEGYLAFREHCFALQGLVRDMSMEYTGHSQEGWRIADIEMAIYNKIRELQKSHVRP